MPNYIPRFRFLIVTIFASALLLTAKIGDIWQGLSGLLDGKLSVATADAQQTTGADRPAAGAPGTQPVTLPGVQPPGGAPATQPAALPGVQPPAGAPGAAQTPPPGAPAAGGASPAERAVARFITDDPTLLTQSEIDLLQQLAERRELIETRERDIERRMGLLQAAEQRIERRVAELKTLQTTIEGLLKSHQTEQDTKLASMVKLYETMKPKEAARVFQQLEMDTLLRVAERMSERKLAPIMASMSPDKAKEVTTELIRLRQLPKPGS